MRRGFSLLEVLLALGIMASALMAVAGAVDAGARRVLAARELVVVSRLAAAKLQEVVHTQELSEVLGRGEFEEYPGYTWEVDASESELLLAELELGEDLMRVTVTITWDRGERSFTMVTRRPEKLEQLR